MTPIADMIERMLAENVPMHVIVLAVRTAELSATSGKSGGIPVDTTAEKRRAYDRERKAKTRKSGGKSGGIPPDVPNALPSLPSIETQKGEERKEEPARRKTGHALPDDWKPKPSHYRIADECHRSHADVDAKAEEVRLWARANAHRAVARKSDWDAMFTGCLRRDWSKSNGARNGHAATRTVGSAFDDLIARAEGGRGEGDYGDPDNVTIISPEGR